MYVKVLLIILENYGFPRGGRGGDRNSRGIVRIKLDQEELEHVACDNLKYAYTKS